MAHLPKLRSARDVELALIYRHTHRDFKGVLNGERSVLVYRNGTTLVPLSQLTDTERTTRLADAMRAEARRYGSR